MIVKFVGRELNHIERFPRTGIGKLMKEHTHDGPLPTLKFMVLLLKNLINEKQHTFNVDFNANPSFHR